MRAHLLLVTVYLAIAVAAIGTTFASAGFLGAAHRAPAVFGTLSAFPSNGGTDASLPDDRVQDLQRALRHTVR